MKKTLCVVMLGLLSLLPATATMAGGKPPDFSDLTGHWAEVAVVQAAQAGWVDGYPDGTFRPNASVTRAEFVKLLVKAGAIPMMPPNSWQVFNDVGGHWVEEQGYLDTAGAYGVVIPSDYYGAFLPDRPITRREAAVQAVRLLGRQHAVESLDGNITLADGLNMPLWERRYIQEAIQEHILTGYPDNTFRHQHPITRAEAVVIAERTALSMKAGEEPALSLTLNGTPAIPVVPLAIRSGYVYAPADAIYGGLEQTVVRYRYNQSTEDPRLMVFPANNCFRYGSSRIEFPAGAAYAYQRTADDQLQDSDMRRVDLLAPTYLDQGRLMIPVASTGGDGALPYATAKYDAATGRVTITMAADWPGNGLPQTPAAAQLQFFHVTQPVAVSPGLSADVPLPEAVDAAGNRLGTLDSAPFTIHVAVDSASPLRLQQSSDGPMVTSLDLPKYATNNARLVVDQSQSPIPEGTWNVTYSAPGFTAVSLAVTVSDYRPAKLAVTAAPASAGQAQTITVQLLDSRGRVVDQSYRSDYENAGPVLTVTLPDGTTAPATPVVHTDPDTGRPFIIVHGAGTFSFTPSTPGLYHYAAHFHTPYSNVPAYGDFDASTDITITP